MSTTHQSEEILENLPKFEKVYDQNHSEGDGLPYSRLKRWIESQEGQHIDDVIHKFVNLKWLLQVHRTLYQLRRKIEMDTFMEDGVVMYCIGNSIRPIEGGLKEVYVHPKTRRVVVYRPPSAENLRKAAQKKLDAKFRVLGDYHQLYKKDGIWYEVKATPFSEKQQKNLTIAERTWGCNNGFERKGPKDILLERNSSWKRIDEKIPFVKIISKRQLNRKELKKYGLSNSLASTHRQK